MNRKRRVLDKRENDSSSARRRVASKSRGRLARACRRAGRAGVAASLAALMLATSFAGFAARAQTTTQGQVGPINPDTGFPFWYEDAKGLRLDLCIDNNPLCLTTLPDPAKPALVAADEADSNFPDEAFWWAADAKIDLPNGGRAILVLAAEAAFANRIQAGDQISFGRVRIRIDNLDEGGTYRVSHPYGVDVFENVGSGPRGINFTEDIGINRFPQGLLDSRVKPFLTWDTFGLRLRDIAPGDAAPPPGYVGDPAVEHKVKGSQILDAAGKPQNYFRIEKIDPVTREVTQLVAETDLFAVQGKLAALSVVASPRGGTYDTAQEVTLTSTDPNAFIFYTVNGKPNVFNDDDRIFYTEPITIAADSTLRFFAVDTLGNTTAAVTEIYKITGGGAPQEPPPVAAPSLKEPGPIDPNTGFPMWYEDLNGLRMDLCVKDTALCLTTIPDPNLPGVVAADEADSNFPDEAFWWAGDARIDLGNGGRALLVMAAEAAFNNRIQAGDQMSFGRVRIRIDNLEPGASYRVTHPYGTDEFDNVEGGDRGINFTEDIGTTEFPRGIMKSRIGPFLTWDTFGPDAVIAPGDAAPPSGYVGDPAVEHKVKGSPHNQNFFRIEKIDPVTREVIAVVGETDLFTVAGKIATLDVVASPHGGSYAGAKSVALVANDPAAKVFYTMTTDGTMPADPTGAGRTEYAGPIALGTAAGLTTTLKFVAEITNADETVTRSEVVTETYTVDNTAPVVTANPAPGFYNTPRSVTLTANEPAVIFYTTDGSDPSSPANVARVRFTVPIPLPLNRAFTIKFAGRDLAGNMSAVTTATYTIDTIPPTVTASPAGGVFATLPSVTLTANEPSTIFYTTDGSDPSNPANPSRRQYTGAIALSQNTTLRFVAWDLAGNLSPVVSQTYTLAVPNAPSNLSVRNQTAGRLDLNWRDNSANETGFEIERSTSQTGGFVRIATVGSNTTDYVDPNLTKDATFFYRVRAVNASGASGYSNVANNKVR